MKKIASLLFVLLFLVVCRSVPLTQEAKSVRPRKATQQATLDLDEKCKPVGNVKSFNHHTTARNEAAKRGATDVQLLFEGQLGTPYVVRFWQCPTGKAGSN